MAQVLRAVSGSKMWSEAVKSAAAAVFTVDGNTISMCPTIELAEKALAEFQSVGREAFIRLPVEGPQRFIR